MGSHPITFLWLWPATDHEPHCRQVPINKIWRWTESTPRKRMMTQAGIYNDCSTRKIRNNCCRSSRWSGFLMPPTMFGNPNPKIVCVCMFRIYFLLNILQYFAQSLYLKLISNKNSKNKHTQPTWILQKKRQCEWQWHQLGYICKSICPSWRPTNSVKALRH